MFTRRVEPGHELEYEALAREMIEASEAFPGQLGATMLHEADSPNYTLLSGEQVSRRFLSGAFLLAGRARPLPHGVDSAVPDGLS